MNEIEANKEVISAMLDDELRAKDCERCALLIKETAELREAWDTYALIGDLMRGTPASAMPAAFAERIMAEPTVLAPQSAAMRRRVSRYALPAAAAAAGIGFVTWISLNMLPMPNTEVALASLPPMSAGASVGANTSPASGGIEDYLLAHQPFSLTSPMQGVAPYVRMISDQSESARQ